MELWRFRTLFVLLLALTRQLSPADTLAADIASIEDPVAAAESRSGQPVKHRTEFSFLHTYESTGRYWQGLQKAGLLRPTNGIRLMNSPWSDPQRRFNDVARFEGSLWQILEERNCPLIVDRVVGGSMYSPYDFDSPLIDRYTALLGDKFLGGQVHEPASNTCSDWIRFVIAGKEYAQRPIDPNDPVLQGYFHWNDVDHWLDYGTLEDYAGRVRYGAQDSYWNEVTSKAERHAARFNGRFAYCEGSEYGRFAWHHFYQRGATSCLAEVGVWASRQTPLMIAALRGAAKAANKPWGVVFTAWGPSGGTCFIPVEENTWQVSKKMLDDSRWPVGPELGCSTALQRRIFFHAYLSGAHTLQEEWGAECNLLSWDEGTLSSSGNVVRELLDFQQAHPDVGKPYTPIALVLDANVPPPRDSATWNVTVCGQLFRHADADERNASREAAGSAEVDCYPPCALPEIFDIVPSDAPDSLWSEYEEIIPIDTKDLPQNARPCRPHEVYERLADAVQRLSPFARTTHLPMQINRRDSDGVWIVALYNPWGAARGNVDTTGSVLNEQCAISDTIRSRFSIASVKTAYAWPTSSAARLEGNDVQVTLGPGGTLVLEIIEGKAAIQ